MRSGCSALRARRPEALEVVEELQDRASLNSDCLHNPRGLFLIVAGFLFLGFIHRVAAPTTCSTDLSY